MMLIFKFHIEWRNSYVNGTQNNARHKLSFEVQTLESAILCMTKILNFPVWITQLQ